MLDCGEGTKVASQRHELGLVFCSELLFCRLVGTLELGAMVVENCSSGGMAAPGPLHTQEKRWRLRGEGAKSGLDI